MNMRKEREWVAGAHLYFSRNTRNKPEAQEGITFGICHALSEANVQIYDISQGVSLAAIFTLISPSRRSAERQAFSTINETLTNYAGAISLSHLAVVPKDEVHEMMLSTQENTWPIISNHLPEVAQNQHPSNNSEHLAEVISIFSPINRRQA